MTRTCPLCRKKNPVIAAEQEVDRVVCNSCGSVFTLNRKVIKNRYLDQHPWKDEMALYFVRTI